MNHPAPLLVFTKEEIELIGHTADALTAYMGKPVIAEIMDADDTGAEWVAFGMPLGLDDEIDEESAVMIQLGGPGARYAGNRGGLDDDEAYSCECLWIIQLSDDVDEGRYVKVDPLTQEFVASNILSELLPFDVSDEAFAQISEEMNGDENIADDEEDAEDTRRMDQLLDQLQPGSRRLH